MEKMIKKLKDTKVLVTGAEGFIGSHLVRLLYNLGAQVNAVVHPESLLWRIEDMLAKIKVWPVDLLDEDALEEALYKSNPVKIYHLAANIDHRRSVSLLKEIFYNNVGATLNLLRLSCDLNLDCFINTGTCEEYGMNEVPFTEEQRECPVSPYSLSKVCNTYVSKMFHTTFGLPTVTVRPFLTYGPAQGPNMFIPSLIIACFKNHEFKMTHGEQNREFVYIDDVVEGYVNVSIAPEAIGEVINLGNGKEYHIRDVALLVKQLIKTDVKLHFGAVPYAKSEIMEFYSSPEKAKRLLNWKAKVGLEEGLKKTIDWYRKHYREVE